MPSKPEPSASRSAGHSASSTRLCRSSPTRDSDTWEAEGPDGAEVLLALFRQPGMSETKFQADIEWVRRDLLVLRTMPMA